MVRGFSRFVPFLFLGLLRAPTRNSPERVRDTIWTFPEKSGKPPGLETPRLSFSQDIRSSHHNCYFLVGEKWQQDVATTSATGAATTLAIKIRARQRSRSRHSRVALDVGLAPSAAWRALPLHPHCAASPTPAPTAPSGASQKQPGGGGCGKREGGWGGEGCGLREGSSSCLGGGTLQRAVGARPTSGGSRHSEQP